MEGMTVYYYSQQPESWKSWKPGHPCILLEAEQPASLATVQELVSELLKRRDPWKIVLLAYGWAKQEISKDRNERFNERFPLVMIGPYVLGGRNGEHFTSALAGLEPNRKWTAWFMDLAEELGITRRYVELDGLQATTSSVLAGRHGWSGLVPDEEIASLWALRGLIPRERLIVVGSSAKYLPNALRDTTRRTLGIPSHARVLFFPGFPSNDYRTYGARPDLQTYTFSTVVGSILKNAAKSLLHFVMIVRPHPRAEQENSRLKRHVNVYDQRLPNFRIIWVPADSPISYDECIAASDLVACMPTSNYPAQATYRGRRACIFALGGDGGSGDVFIKLFGARENEMLGKMLSLAISNYPDDVTSALRRAAPLPKRDPGNRAKAIADTLLGL